MQEDGAAPDPVRCVGCDAPVQPRGPCTRCGTLGSAPPAPRRPLGARAPRTTRTAPWCCAVGARKAAASYLQHPGRQRDRPHSLAPVDPGVLHGDFVTKSALAFSDATLHLHPGPFRLQPREIHLLGTDGPALRAAHLALVRGPDATELQGRHGAKARTVTDTSCAGLNHLTASSLNSTACFCLRHPSSG